MRTFQLNVEILIGLLLLIYCWLELFYRVFLYFHYGAQPFLNHVEDDYFGNMYFIATVSTTCFIVSYSIRREDKFVCRVAYSLAVIYILSLYLINKVDVLVSYSEFARNLGP